MLMGEGGGEGNAKEIYESPDFRFPEVGISLDYVLQQ